MRLSSCATVPCLLENPYSFRPYPFRQSFLVLLRQQCSLSHTAFQNPMADRTRGSEEKRERGHKVALVFSSSSLVYPFLFSFQQTRGKMGRSLDAMLKYIGKHPSPLTLPLRSARGLCSPLRPVNLSSSTSFTRLFFSPISFRAFSLHQRRESLAEPFLSFSHSRFLSRTCCFLRASYSGLAVASPCRKRCCQCHCSF